jgi:hypothetical protein
VFMARQPSRYGVVENCGARRIDEFQALHYRFRDERLAFEARRRIA